MTEARVKVPQPEGKGPEPELRTGTVLLTRSGRQVHVAGVQEVIEGEPQVVLHYMKSGKNFSFPLSRARAWLRGAVPFPPWAGGPVPITPITPVPPIVAQVSGDYFTDEELLELASALEPEDRHQVIAARLARQLLALRQAIAAEEARTYDA